MRLLSLSVDLDAQGLLVTTRLNRAAGKWPSLLGLAKGVSFSDTPKDDDDDPVTWGSLASFLGNSTTTFLNNTFGSDSK